MIKGFIPRDLWKYIDLEIDIKYKRPEEVIYNMIWLGATLLRELIVAKKILYSSLQTSSKYNQLQYQWYLDKETKIQNKIISMTIVVTKVLLYEDKSIQV
jgi:hypothetical protein